MAAVLEFLCPPVDQPESLTAKNLVRDRARRLQTRAIGRTVTLDDVDLCCRCPTPDQWLA
jgi:hypothetical protein